MTLADRLTNPGTITISMENLISPSTNLQMEKCSTPNCSLEPCSMGNMISIEDTMEDSMETTRNVLLSEMEEGCSALGISECISQDHDDISIDSDLLTLKPRNRVINNEEGSDHED